MIGLPTLYERMLADYQQRYIRDNPGCTVTDIVDAVQQEPWWQDASSHFAVEFLRARTRELLARIRHHERSHLRRSAARLRQEAPLVLRHNAVAALDRAERASERRWQSLIGQQLYRWTESVGGQLRPLPEMTREELEQAASQREQQAAATAAVAMLLRRLAEPLAEGQRGLDAWDPESLLDLIGSSQT